MFEPASKEAGSFLGRSDWLFNWLKGELDDEQIAPAVAESPRRDERVWERERGHPRWPEWLGAKDGTGEEEREDAGLRIFLLGG